MAGPVGPFSVVEIRLDHRNNPASPRKHPVAATERTAKVPGARAGGLLRRTSWACPVGGPGTPAASAPQFIDEFSERFRALE